MNIIPTELNRHLSEIVLGRIAAEAFWLGHKSGFWRWVGFGLVACGVGAAVGIGCYGYSYVAMNSDQTNILAATFSKSLSNAQLKASAEGTVKIEPSEISLANNQTINLDSQSRLRLDPEARVFADGELRVQPPTIAVPQSTVTRPSSKIPNITNFTVFKSLPYEGGRVFTGWIFLTSIQKFPTHQYCYYTTDSQDTPGLGIRVDIGSDEKLEAPKSLPKGFDVATAFSKCVWFQR